MTPRDDDSDDDLTALFGAAGGGAPPPDPDFLAKLRDLSTDAFLGAEPAPSPPTPSAPKRRSPMLAILLRASTTAVAAALLIGVAVRFSTKDEPPGLAQVLDRVADADTLHLTVTENGQTQDVWVAKGNKLRWEETAERYQIAQGQNSYRVDEAANRVTSGVADYFRPDRSGVDVFALLGLRRPSQEAIRNAKWSRANTSGEPTDTYELELATRSGSPVAVSLETDLAGNLRRVEVDSGKVREIVSTHIRMTLVVLAVGQPVPEEKFAVKPTLAEDGRVGKIVDVQGLVSVKPVTYARWTPVRPGLLLMPGDWVRADLRGANAATMRLLPQALVTVGPGGLLEVTKPNQIKLHEGEAEITPAKKVPIELTAPNGEKVTLTERTHYRVEREQLVKVEKEPLWLRGFKGTTNNESIGSLVAKVDGRNVQLSVGYHKVTVEIRDQIARTVIEESFVNHTDGQLEGQFHFPLPQDASIAGFAMDVNGEMVEADVVEKQRAREIFEEIKRERRDPGLLEWTGGNIFKARVWPIFPHSEKRVRITYTQVLPLQGKQYRYSYALQSEMLQQNPLKQLAINFHVSSAVPLKSVTSPTHSVRTQKTDHAAKLEFAAQEHTPTRDFEAVIEVADAAPQVTVIPHRRGSDGYFLVQVTPPAGAAPDRALIASADALNLTLVCDTSASMDPTQRNAQHAVAASLLEALTPKDTFNLAACDVNTDWAFDRPQQATPENVAKARAFLMNRVSLGWTDLDKAFASAIQQAGGRGHVVYLGDGVVTTGNANPQEFAKRLTDLYKATNASATFHAVALGSSFEPGVLKAVGSLGSGSVRRVTNEQGPVAVALELLGEITRPPVRDLRVEFTNWKTASVYPETLANLVPGTQQILIGRYLPEGADQQGEVVVTGVQNGQEVRYAAKAILKDAESGNSFLPRLWARMHLEKLLEKPQTQAVKDDIIALSEEFHIMTPYTSFLVLESDADRERFKVKRRFLMRDGEQFFADGRNKADFELAREQMRKAGEWRTGLRRDVLTVLNTLGRMTPQADRGRYDRYAYGKSRLAKLSESLDGGEHLFLAALDRPGAEGLGADDFLGRFKRESAEDELVELETAKSLPGGLPTNPGEPIPDAARFELFAGDGLESDVKQLRQLKDLELQSEFATELAAAAEDRRGLGPTGGFGGGGFGFAAPKPASGPALYSRAGGYGGRGPGRPSFQRWFDAVIPTVPAAGTTPAPKATWPQEARDLARSLLRRDALAKLPGGVAIERQTTSLDADGQAASRDQAFELLSPRAWLVRTAGDTNPTLTHWCDGTDRGAYMAAWQLGRVRAAVPSDLTQAPVNTADYSWTSADEVYAHFTATVEQAGDLRVIVAKQTNHPYEVRFTIDPAKKVLVKVEDFHGGKSSTVRTFSDFVEVGGTWWATRTEYTVQGKRQTTTTQTVAALTAEKFAEQLKAATADRAVVQFLRSPEVTVAEAKAKNAAGTATVDDQFALLNHFAGYQQWAKAGDHLAALETLAADKPGVRWLRTIFLQASRRGEELRKVLLAEAAKLPALPPGDRLTVANFLYSQATAALAPNEQLALLDTLRPAYADLPKRSHQRRQWQQNRVYALQNSGKNDEAFALLTEMATEYPTDYSVQHNLANWLYNRGDREAALAHIKKQFAKEANFSEWEKNNFRNQYAQWLESAGRLPEVVAFTAEWIKEVPDADYAYSVHLSALVRTGEQEKADGLVEAWLKEAQVPGKVPLAAQARFQAAANLTMGRGHNLYTDRLDPRWVKHLAEAVRFFADHETASSLADSIAQNGHFQHTDEGRKVYRELFDGLVRDAATMPVTRLTPRLQLIQSANFEVEAGTWPALGKTLRDRWSKVEDPNQQYWLGQAVAQFHANRLERTAYLDFLRQQWRDGPDAFKSQAIHSLFEALIVTEWTGEREAELFALLPQLGDGHADTRTATQVAMLHRLTDQMVALRNTLLLKDLKNPEKLTRTELAAKHAELLNAARRGYTERLAKAETELPEPLRPWAKAERLYLLTRVGGDAKPIVAEVWEFIGAAPKARPQDDVPSAKRDLEDLVFDRFLGMALYFAARANAEPALVERTRKYLDAGIAAEPNEAGWKSAKFQLLVALDKPQELEAALAEWAKQGDADGRWRTALGYVLAEQGKLAEAIKLFEAVDKADELTYSHYQALAGWYMAVNKKDEHETALKQSFRALDENVLSQLVYSKAQVWSRGVGQMPNELDRDTIRIFAAIFEKSSYPANFLHSLRQVYGQTRDFRLLAVMCDAVIGQSAGKIYPFLGTCQVVLNEVRDEATADQMLAHVEKLRAAAQTTVDHRALDLLELQVRRRMAEVRNQPGQQAEKALAAMRRAFDREWADGEPLMMSNLLRDFGHITRPDLATEQLRELKELHAAAKAGTHARMHMAHNYGIVLGHQGRHEEAIALMRKAMAEYATATHGGAFTNDLQGVQTTTMYFHETLKQYDKAEELYLTAAKKPANDQVAYWLSHQLYQLYLRALDRGHAVSLGEGKELYKALEAKLVKEVGHPEQNHNHNLLGVLLRVYRTAQPKGIGNVAADLKAFVQKAVPPMLKKHPQNYNSLVADIARAVRDLVGAEEGVVFLLDRIDDEPAWLRLNNQDGWAYQGYMLAQWRAEAKNLNAKVEARLLKLVLDELRRDLRTQTHRNRHMYMANHSYYWKEKEFEFAKVAEEVHAERKPSGPAVAYVAEYFYHGCNRADRAIEVMFAAHAEKRLNANQQLRLVDYLFWTRRHAEAVPILLPLVEKSPETLHYRAQLCYAYHHSGRQPELKAAFAAAEAFFRDKSRWAEPAMSVLGHVATECQLNEQAVTIYGELIPLHQRTAPNRGIGNGTLTTYYGNLARAHSALGNTVEAVDAASGAVVAWGNNINGRTQALATLQSVLTNSPDLDKFVEHLDKETGETGLINPVVRKATGQAYFNKAKYQQASMQLQAALSVQPNDAETHQLLLRCYDELKQPDAAVAQILRGLELSRRDIAQYRNLGDRFVSLSRNGDAERAYTSIVEVLPNEAEGHAMLADIRQKQDRWADAAKHWEQVAAIRALEPTGLLGLAAAQVHLKQWDEAAATVGKLKAKTWPAHFPQAPQQIAELESQLNAAKK